MNSVNKDAWSSGQIGSKLWLCDELERVFINSAGLITKPEIALLGGWYGMAAFLLLSRNNIPIKMITSFDIDPGCQPIADMINENWIWRDRQFTSITADANKVDLGKYDIVINTSTEHFENQKWFDKLELGTLVAVQSNNMPHADHIVTTDSEYSLRQQFPMNVILSVGSKKFEYEDWSFTRFMLIGKK